MIYCFLAPGFEETEAVAAVDTIRRGDVAVTTVGLGGKAVTGSHGITVLADLADSELHDISDMTGILLPGGMPGTLNLDHSDLVDHCLRYAYDNGKLIAAICAAPSLLGKRGMLEGRTAVCYDGFEALLTGATVGSGRTETDGNIITACGAGAAIEFGLAVLRATVGEEKANAFGRSMKCRD